MSAGLLIRNNSDELVFSSDAFTFGYLGRGTYISTTAPNEAGPTKRDGYSTYQIVHAGEIMVALPVHSTYRESTALISTVRIGDTWTIRITTGDGTETAGGFLNQQASAPYIFGVPVADPGYGLTIYAPDGSLRADLTRPPLAIAQRVTLAAGSYTGLVISNPNIAVIGTHTANRTVSGPMSEGSALYKNSIYRYGWWRDEMTDQLYRQQMLRMWWDNDDGPIGTTDNRPEITVLIIDTTNL